MLVTQVGDAAREALGPWWTFLIAGVHGSWTSSGAETVGKAS
jgi:hypothetical protein